MVISLLISYTGYCSAQIISRSREGIPSGYSPFSNLSRDTAKLQIVNGEEENSDQKCAKVCSGSTGRASTAFKDYSDGKNVYLDVDMSECGFAKIPNVVISVEGSSHHWNVLGSSSVYNTTPTTFRVYLNNGNAGLNKSLLDDKKWNIEWIAVGFTC